MSNPWSMWGLEFFLKVLMIPLEWLPLPCYIALDLVIRIFWIVLLGKVLKFVWDALPIA